MKFPIPFLLSTGRAPLDVEIPDDTDPYWRHKVALDIAVRAGSDLCGSNLSYSNLARADLAGANLAGADLAGADLASADLAHADLADAPIMLGYPNGWAAWAYPAQHNKALRISVGCRRDWTLAMGRDYWRGKDDRREVMAALDYAEAVAKLRGWKIDD